MPYHEWGDKDFNWKALDKAIEFISDRYQAYSQHYPIMKEKYGTIRYEFIHTWLKTDKDFHYFCSLLLQACARFPSVQEEILEDWIDHIVVSGAPTDEEN